MNSRQPLNIWLCLLFLLALPLSTCLGQVTPPEDYLGFKPGADFHLMTYEQAMEYFEHLADQTDRMIVLDMGATSEGRRMKYGVISSSENLARLEEYKDLNRQLSLSRSLTDEQATTIADEGKVIVWIDGGLHGTEVAPAQLLPQLAHDLVSGDDHKIRLIRENVITLLVFANPDGMTIVSDWYMNNVGTPYEVSPLPWLYHKYVGHDNNRDSFMANLIETQNMNKATTGEWFPEILYNQHQTGPFPARIWIPPDAEPTNPNVHPLIVRWKNLIGSAMGKAFEEANQPGVISRVRYDTWYPGYATQVVDGYNTVSILTETQLYRYATPQFFTLRDFPEAHQDLIKGVFYPNPWEGGWWRLGDAVAYNRTACLAVLETAEKYKYEFLYNKWRMGRDTIKRYKNEPPYGWLIPLNQNDPHATALMLSRFILNGIEVYQSEEAFVHNGLSYPRGSYIIPTSQPFGLFTKNILEKQRYPDLKKYAHLWQGIVGSAKVGKEPLRAYDGAGWTLPIQMGVEYHEMSRGLDVKKTLIDEVTSPSGTITGSGSHYVFSHSDNGSFIAVNRILEAGGKVSCALADFTLGGQSYPKGTFVVNSGSISGNKLRDIASEIRIRMRGGRVNARTKPVRKNRIALYKSWVASMDAGWITYLFDNYDFPVHLLTDAEVKAGHLRNRFDVIVLPDQRSSSIINGHRKGTMPPDYVGGITSDGVDHLKAFVKAGGILVCNKSSVDLPIKEFRFPIKNVLEDVKSDSFNCPGSILKMDYNADHPLSFGMQKRGVAFFSRGQAFEMIKDAVETEEKKEKEVPGKGKERPPKKKKPKPNYVKVEPEVVATYPTESLLISGWIHGDEVIREKAAILDVPFGEGRVILFGFNVHNRAQAHSTFKLLFNSLYF